MECGLPIAMQTDNWNSDEIRVKIYGRVAEWLKAAVLKTVERKFRGFESYLFRQFEKG